MAWLRGVNVDQKDVERDISMTISEMAAYENVSSVSYKSLCKFCCFCISIIQTYYLNVQSEQRVLYVVHNNVMVVTR